MVVGKVCIVLSVEYTTGGRVEQKGQMLGKFLRQKYQKTGKYMPKFYDWYRFWWWCYSKAC